MQGWRAGKHKEILIAFGVGIPGAALLSFLLYDSAWGMLLTPIPVFVLYRKLRKVRLGRENRALTKDFSMAVTTAAGALSAGFSMENAWREAEKELELACPEGRMCFELREICNSLDMNIPIENLIIEFANRTELEDISTFAEVFVNAKRTGGEMISILEKTASQIREKIEIVQEIEVMLAEKKLEQRIMDLLPLLMLLFLRFSAGDYMGALYHNAVGILVMTVCFAGYIGAFVLSEKIMEVKI